MISNVQNVAMRFHAKIHVYHASQLLYNIIYTHTYMHVSHTLQFRSLYVITPSTRHGSTENTVMGIVQFQIIYQSIGVIFQYHYTLHRESHMPIDRTYVFKIDYLPSLSNPLYLGQKPWFLVERFHYSLYKSTFINSLTT